MNTRRTTIIGLLLAAGTQLFAAVGGGAVSWSGAGNVAVSAVVSAPSKFVASIKIRIVPGHVCKAYVGGLGMNTATLSNTFAVLYPNASGGHSEEWSLADPRNGDGIDTTRIFVNGDCPGEFVTVAYVQTGTLTAMLTPITYGLRVAAAAGTPYPFWSGSSTTAAVASVWVVPGYVGKIRIRAGFANQSGSDAAILYPNTGQTSQSSARSEHFEVRDSLHTINPSLLYLVADVGGEGALVTVWRWMT